MTSYEEQYAAILSAMGDDASVRQRAIVIARELQRDDAFLDVRHDMIDAVKADDMAALRAAVARAELDATTEIPNPGRIPGLPPAAAVDQVAALSAELGTYVQEGRLPPARQRAHTRALLGALHDAEALAFAVSAARRTLADCY